MQKVLLILLLLLTVVEQTTAQICSSEYCRRTQRDDCRCRGCCGSKFGCNNDRLICQKNWDHLRRKSICSCNCYACTHGMGPHKPGRTATPPQGGNDTRFSE